ncbi:AfsA-related hotdog domain-containing protein [Paracoccus siganidrum]|nr:AfsA-related hotdog domain-containing protein [Paracoccus siganidrum]
MIQYTITPEILHKDCAEDVLLSDFELVLPARLNRETTAELDRVLAPAEKALLDEAYARIGDRYFLRHQPTHIPAACVNAVPGLETDIARTYRLEGDTWCVDNIVVPSGIGEVVDIHPDGGALTERQRQAVSQILADRLENGICPVNRYRVLNDTQNYFFYRKTHEHVPGLMLIEIARQAMYHYFYNHSGYSRGEVSISISSLDVEFYSYVESAYALDVVVTQTQELARKQPRFVDKTATFYQNGRMVSRIRLQGGAMKMKLFKRMRTLKFPPAHWFTPSSRILQRAILADQRGEILCVALERLSSTGIRFRAPALPEQPPHSITLHVSGQGFLTLPLQARTPRDHGGQYEMDFAELSADQRYRLQETIKCHCFFAERHDPDAAASRPAIATRAAK